MLLTKMNERLHQDRSTSYKDSSAWIFHLLRCKKNLDLIHPKFSFKYAFSKTKKKIREAAKRSCVNDS